MPDRIVRAGILDSENVNKLSYAAEVFYRRLMSVVDDHGRYDGRASVLRARLYPLRLDKVSEPDVEKWLAECAEAALVRCYMFASKPYLEMSRFGQRIRSASKFPPPPSSADICQQLADTCGPPTNTHTDTNSERKGGLGENRNILPQLKVEISKHFNRSLSARWNYEEEFALAEVCRRPQALEEWSEIIAYSKQPGAFPSLKVLSVLTNWGGELDKARNHKPAPKEITAEQREAREAEQRRIRTERLLGR